MRLPRSKFPNFIRLETLKENKKLNKKNLIQVTSQELRSPILHYECSYEMFPVKLHTRYNDTLQN